jgi:hypothetical protein
MDPFLLRNLLLTGHIVGAVGVFAGLGMLCAATDERTRKLGSMLHGISLVLLLLVGLHMLLTAGLVKTGGWWHTKVVIWLLLGAAPVLVKRKVMPPGVVLGFCLLLGAVAAFLGLQKPF